MKELLLADYIGGCDADGNPLGHTLKVLNEYSGYLNHNMKVIIASTKEVIAGIRDYEIYVLPYSNQTQVSSSMLYKINYRAIMIRNLRYIMKSEYPVIWFVNNNAILFIYLCMFGKGRKKLICTMFQDGYKQGKLGRITNLLYKSQLKRIDLIVSSNQRFSFQETKTFYMPDYLYSDKYKKYKRNKKEQIAVLGTFDRRKNIHKYIKLLDKNGMRVIVAGTFLEKKYYDEMRCFESDHIEIIDKFLSYDEYYNYLAESMFILLPYNMEIYKDRTSGVLIESLFLDTIPIAPKRLLDYNDVEGIPLEGFVNDPSMLKDLKNRERFYESYNNQRKNKYNEDMYTDSLIKTIVNL